MGWLDAYAALVALRNTATLQRAAVMRVTRKKLGLRRAEAGSLFGGGASAFSKYERGKTRPHKSTVKLLKLLHRHPKVLAEVDGSVALSALISTLSAPGEL